MCVCSVSNREDNTALLASFLFTCQPIFNYLAATAHGPVSDSVRSQLLECSQILCNKLENLVLTCAGSRLVSLNEAEPQSISHFHIGQFRLSPFSVTIFWYCRPTPFLAQADTGFHKRMRWNVGQLGETETDNTEFYFLCCEDVDTLSGGVRMWSIGQWIQVSPETDDIEEILCGVPQGTYLKRMILGSEEPSCGDATDCLLQLIMLDQK
uniref:Uncharacterized protein n=1 Tax=Periophthalmus magnuspinnatus TaxID=409849 RepID=A0A3B3ZNY3_9GOBI